MNPFVGNDKRNHANVQKLEGPKPVRKEFLVCLTLDNGNDADDDVQEQVKLHHDLVTFRNVKIVQVCLRQLVAP